MTLSLSLARQGLQSLSSLHGDKYITVAGQNKIIADAFPTMDAIAGKKGKSLAPFIAKTALRTKEFPQRGASGSVASDADFVMIGTLRLNINKNSKRES